MPTERTWNLAWLGCGLCTDSVIMWGYRWNWIYFCTSWNAFVMSMRHCLELAKIWEVNSRTNEGRQEILMGG